RSLTSRPQRWRLKRMGRQYRDDARLPFEMLAFGGLFGVGRRTRVWPETVSALRGIAMRGNDSDAPQKYVKAERATPTAYSGSSGWGRGARRFVSAGSSCTKLQATEGACRALP